MKRVIALFLSLLMLASTAGVTMATHYCKGKAYKSSIGFLSAKPFDCGMHKKGKAECNDNLTFFNGNCCENHTQKLQLEDEYFTSSFDVNLNTQFAEIFILSYTTLTEQLSAPFFNYNTYIPPPLIHDVPVMIQSFLI